MSTDLPAPQAAYLPMGSPYEAILRVKGGAIAVTDTSISVVLSIDGHDKVIVVDRGTGATREP